MRKLIIIVRLIFILLFKEIEKDESKYEEIKKEIRTTT